MPSGHKCEDRLKSRREDGARRDVLKTAVKRWLLSEIALIGAAFKEQGSVR